MNPTPQDSSRRIETWLYSITRDDLPDEDHARTDAHPGKRACRPRSNDDETFLYPYNAPNTPPLTDCNITAMQSSTPRRKRRNDGGDAEGGTGVDNNLKESEKTPRPSTSSWRLASSPHKRVAGTSPRKSRAVLDRLEKPVRVHALPTLADALAKLPADITPLYRRIVTAIGLQRIIPHEVREEVAGLMVESPGYFRETDTGGAKEALGRLRSILRKASDGQSRQRGETAWYIHVHSPLLDLAFNPDIPDLDEITSVRARYEPVMSAGIAGNSIPFLKGSQGVTSEPACSISLDSEALGSEEGSRAPSNVSLSKVRSHSAKIDFVVALDIPYNTPLQRTISYLVDEGTAQPHINQTGYLPLKESPIAVSFEMKTEARGSGDAFVQLGIWVTAWHKRMYDLRSCLTRRIPAATH
ncbi:hypothetical protein DHEL01_v211867 [Diaporthe helianthi]|uniref:PD-(D/E)XK nuclease-like domain-containing protein n=1 Tax=Diaporthe helianthi TaxID=158607 RepID=A0A2P5HHL5_DIAHE|nr:hypothetical protein DHEL01_v211867 [Diaporthe helianthi]